MIFSYFYHVLDTKKNSEQTVTIPRQEYEKLKFELEQLKRMLFGKKSERFVPSSTNQLNIFSPEIPPEEQEPAEKYTVTYQREKKKSKKKQAIRTEISSHLPRVEEIIEPENIVEGSVKIGEEITELLEITPATIFVRRIIRPKYALPKEQGIIIAELPSLPIPKGNAGASLLAFIAVSKFEDHLPLYRIRKIFKRQELDVSPSTISGWSGKTADLLLPLYDELKENFLQDANYLQSDESPIKVQDKNKKKALHQGYMWAYRNPIKRLVLFEYNKGRGLQAPLEFFKNFKGTLQTDGYNVYQALVKANPNITLLGCMAHARRYFEKALDNDPRRAEHVLLLIQKLYSMERKAKERNSSIEVIKRYRLIYALPIIQEIELYLKQEINLVLPKSTIGVAMAYTLKIYGNLKQYLYDGRYEIDNNMIENSIRPLAIGRKNYLFAGSHQAAQHYAMFYSFFATCKINNVNPFEWLNDVIRRIPEHKANKLHLLLPGNWSKANYE